MGSERMVGSEGMASKGVASPSPGVDPKRISDLLAPLESFAAKAFQDAEKERHEHDVAVAELLAQLESAREEVRELKEQVGEWEERGKREGLAADRREGEVRQATGRVERLEKEVRGLREKLEEVGAEKERLTKELDGKTEEVLVLETEVRELREKVGGLVRWKVGAEGRLRDRESEALALIREGREERMKGEVASVREGYLEKELMRLTGQLAEAKAKADVLEVEKSTVVREMKKALREAKEEAAEARKNADKVQKELEELERAVTELQADREELKEDGAREIAALTQSVDIYKEASQDAEARLKEMKILVTAMENERMKERRLDQGSGRPRRKRRLTDGLRGEIREQHADNMLQMVQEELDRQTENMEQQRIEYEKAFDSAAKLKVQVSAISRERDRARAEAVAAESRANVSEKKVLELTRRNAELERRIVLVGHRALNPPLSSPATGVKTASGRKDTPDATTISPSRLSLRHAMDELSELRQRHDEIIASITAQRDLYRTMMLSAEKERS